LRHLSTSCVTGGQRCDHHTGRYCAYHRLFGVDFDRLASGWQGRITQRGIWRSRLIANIVWQSRSGNLFIASDGHCGSGLHAHLAWVGVYILAYAPAFDHHRPDTSYREYSSPPATTGECSSADAANGKYASDSPRFNTATIGAGGLRQRGAKVIDKSLRHSLISMVTACSKPIYMPKWWNW
jgi:hypothetical protein